MNRLAFIDRALVINMLFMIASNTAPEQFLRTAWAALGCLGLFFGIVLALLMDGDRSNQ